jgi:replicative DNA helicase Mcm
MEISQEEEAEIIALSQEENIYEKLIFNVAPSISGLEKCKEASLLSMFGGVTKKRKDITIRGNIHCLFVGDAGVAKSQLLTSIAGLAPKAYLSVGEGSSAAGLTAALNRDETTGDWVIDAGALVLSDQGVCCMDEVDKMNENDRKRIHEAMEQQTITIWKAGRHAVLRARTSVIAAANPTLGKYNPDKTVFQNLKFPPTLFSRFDLIFVLIDKPVVANDKSIVRHMLEANSKEFGTVDRETFKKYIAYAKSINPVLNSEAIESLENFFLNIRERMVSESKEDSVSITYRQLDGLVRLTEAHARILLKNKADKSDAEAAIRIFNEYLKDINFDVLTHVTNVPKTVREIEPILEELLINLQRQVCYSDGVPYHIWLEEATEKGVNKEKAKEVILSMYNSGHITKSRENSEETYYRSACRN